MVVKINCPHCQSKAVVKNGKKPNGAQNFKCKEGGKQFLSTYRYKGAEMGIKSLLIQRLLNNRGIREIGTILGVNAKTVLRQGLLLGQNCQISPRQTQDKSVQIDELGS